MPRFSLNRPEKCWKSGIDALVIVAVDQNEAAKIVELAHKYNVKVLSYDRLIKNCDLDLYISFDNVEVGTLQADYLTKRMPAGKLCPDRRSGYRQQFLPAENRTDECSSASCGTRRYTDRV